MSTYEYSYASAHKWLVYHFGRAKKCEKCGTLKSSKYEYALLKGKKHEKSRENYIELCASCHKIYDGIIEHLTRRKYKPVYGIKNGKKYYFSSIKEAASVAAICSQGISHVLKGKRPTMGGYKWIYA